MKDQLLRDIVTDGLTERGGGTTLDTEILICSFFGL
jgi:hypothetical protein